MSLRSNLAATTILALTALASAQTALTYQKPPEAIERLLYAPRTPVVSLSPDRMLMLIEQPQEFPTIAEIAEPRLRLAGLRFNPSTSGPSREVAIVGLQIQTVAPNSVPRPVTGVPSRLRATHLLWSPNGKYIAFQQRALASQPGSGSLRPRTLPDRCSFLKRCRPTSAQTGLLAQHWPALL
jgi:hypothetical protein